MIYQEDWSIAWNASESDEEKCAIAETYREAWKKATSEEEFPFKKWYNKDNELKELTSHIIHDGNRACGNLYHFIEDKNMSLIWQTANAVIFNIQTIYAIKKAIGI
jgi:hypothetical protein